MGKQGIVVHFRKMNSIYFSEFLMHDRKSMTTKRVVKFKKDEVLPF